jgi:hypothetical protein
MKAHLARDGRTSRAIARRAWRPSRRFADKPARPSRPAARRNARSQGLYGRQAQRQPAMSGGENGFCERRRCERISAKDGRFVEREPLAQRPARFPFDPHLAPMCGGPWSGDAMPDSRVIFFWSRFLSAFVRVFPASGSRRVQRQPRHDLNPSAPSCARPYDDITDVNGRRTAGDSARRQSLVLRSCSGARERGQP